MTLCKLYYYGQNSIKYIYPNKILSKSNFVPEKRNVRLEGWLLAGILFLFDPNDVTASCEGKFVLYFLVAKSTLELAGDTWIDVFKDRTGLTVLQSQC